MAKKFDNINKQVITRFSAVVLILAFVFIAFFLLNRYNNQTFPSISGRVILNLNPQYVDGETLKGDFSITLNNGEFIPADSILNVESGNLTQTYKLSDVASNSLESGDFYLSSINLEGSGEGYGAPGTMESYPDVSFILKINKAKIKNSADSSAVENSVVNPDNSITNDSNVTLDNAPNNKANPVNENANVTLQDTEPITEPIQPSLDNQGIATNEITSEIQPSAFDENAVPGITGSAVSELNSKSDEISGVISKNNPFSYDLAEGESAELIDSTQPVNVLVENGKVTITTNYTESVKGYGSDYVNADSGKYTLNIDLSKLNFVPESSNLRISLTYNGLELFLTQADLQGSNNIESNVTDDSNIEANLSETNITLNTNITANVTTNVSVNVTKIIENLSIYDLTENEKALIKSKTGTDHIDIVKSQIVNDRLVIMYQIGEYWVEKTYDPNIPKDELNDQIAIDMAKFAKYLAKTFGTVEETPETVKEYIGNYSL